MLSYFSLVPLADCPGFPRHERVLALQRQQAAASIPAERELRLRARQIAAVDGQIDALVYELYGLGEGEIGVVEGEK